MLCDAASADGDDDDVVSSDADLYCGGALCDCDRDAPCGKRSSSSGDADDSDLGVAGLRRLHLRLTAVSATWQSPPDNWLRRDRVWTRFGLEGLAVRYVAWRAWW